MKIRVIAGLIITVTLGIGYAKSDGSQVKKSLYGDKQKVMPPKAYPIKPKTYPRGTIATH